MKILVSALAGMVTGTLLEPLKTWMNDSVVARQGRHAIYTELGKVYALFVELPERSGHKSDRDRLQKINLDAFHFYYEQRRTAFYRIREWPQILGIYRDFELTRDAVLSGRESLATAYELISGRFKIRFNDGLDQKRVQAGARQWWRHVQRRIKYDPQ